MNEVILSFKERIKEKPYQTCWEYPQEWGGGSDSITEAGVIDFDGLDDKYKMLLYVYAWNLSELCPFRSSVMKAFKWTAYKVSKLFKELKAEGVIESCATFSESTGLLCGRGYQINWEAQKAIECQPKLSIAE